MTTAMTMSDHTINPGKKQTSREKMCKKFSEKIFKNEFYVKQNTNF